MRGRKMRKTKRLTLCALLTALAMVCGYIETLVPLSAAVPGVKLGLANIVVMFALYSLGWADACAISLVRVLLVSLTFGNAFSLAYSAAGAALSLAVMLPLKKCGKFGVTGVSLAGGVAHNVGQIIVAILVLGTSRLVYYLPVLLVSGLVAGICTGAAAGLAIKRVRV